jgi:hypothetical protein
VKVVIHKSVLGNRKHLILEDDEYRWCSDAVENCDLMLTTQDKNSLSEFARLYDIKKVDFIEKKYQKIADVLSVKNPEWKYILPKKVYDKALGDLHEYLDITKELLRDAEYSAHYSRGNVILHELSRIKPNEGVIRDCLTKTKNATVKSTIKSFEPVDDGFCRPLVYNRLKTVTGRLIVEEGPQVLLLPREMKNIFQSRYGVDGSIVWVDFVSLEPRFTKLVTSDETEIDIYTDILHKYNLRCTRDQVKVAVLSTLFGAGLAKLTSIVGKEAILIKKAIKEYFNLGDISSIVGNYKTGKINNYFGRPIKLKKTVANVAMNNFIQSSSVDISLMGFSSFIKDPELPKSVRSLCVIHDALVLDVRNSDIDKLRRIIKGGVCINNVGHFFLGFESYEN